ncbi:hypothetical protein A2697_01400 [Candidatus Curtissbacteria bacterium RIFCSPHIGHO2_01_FULL_41_44]|uniref:Endonuclease GajA/Old nuclease/RecF-like AAA domain-containing protein n=1 Tax=Candidatus Curtissbacteria bacterium RIFCSPLOWO2_01_FULL_42_50 TaxID=1797730 RepID=A0A1F5H3C9_9BACT|nr:MAG: hypothetical protein A3C33_00615 [Candidatus Curtissbacteria bacterium RIFCSPHIGHO2_02_FULL_42_58]OGD94565.1 MAG: hypothetical protein A2697_01400 [Candidatus Curtissbacteria bacterium RIFCSPHIGHO2_01_FULL_41_44]OGD97948.1 MAG: hypothetical protein A3E71_03875 [Candidatus Curtissbacteria bacterium RIFCSPHIGHO2_12_FULL_42_33]OGD98598.1 MAG: hypothetical protein A3B54_05445 [Candidatus Curtissbacteria bacterium RIFCSPLOWO2_01_FULL_42_50]OGE11201.1 MAG: hypothetical protein A3H87_01520 [Ca
MKLGSVIIQNFRSIESCNFSLASGVVAFVGGNESGKSNVLQAISRFLNRDNFKDEDKYQLADTDIFIEIEFVNLTEGEKEKLKLLTNKPSDKLILRRIAEKYEVVFPNIPLPEEIVEEKDKPPETEVEPDKSAETADQSSVTASVNEHEANPESQETNIPVTDEDNVNQESHQGTQLTQEQIKVEILKMMPSAELISTVQDLIVGDNFLIDDLFPTSQRKQEQTPEMKGRAETLRSLLQLGGISDADLREKNSSIRSLKLTKGAARVAQILSKSWHQENIQMNMNSDKENLVILFRDGKNIPDDQKDDPTKWIWTLPNDRSDGFRWYVTFYVRYLFRIRQSDNVIFLIDDAGSPLNKKGQEDLLSEFMNIANDEKNYQIIYVTHSKYMVNWDIRNQIKAVIKKEGGGTVVEDMWWEKFSKNELPAPLDELGVTWAEDFLKHNNLIVEGYVDTYLLHELSIMFSGKIPKDPFKGYKILPAGGIDSEIALGTLCKAHSKKVFLLFDSDMPGISGKTKASRLQLKAGDIKTLSHSQDFTIITIEDFLPKDAYLAAANSVGKKEFAERWPDMSRLQGIRLVGIAQALINRLGNEGLDEANAKEFIRIFKYDIAKQCVANIKIESYTDEQLNSVINFFRALNRKLE